MGVLDKIIETKKERLKSAKSASPLASLKSAITDQPPPRDFASAIKRGNGIRLIAELKKASPSKGLIRADFDPTVISRIYADRADAISVLTEEDFFSGDIAYIKAAKAASSLPALRKDFIFDEYQIFESRANSADAVLLIAAALEKNQAAEYLALAAELGLAVLFEVHNMPELETALAIGADIIGINNRNLTTLDVDLQTTFDLKAEVPEGRTLVSESGIRAREDITRLDAAGVDAMLIGTAFMEAPNIGSKMDELLGRQA